MTHGTLLLKKIGASEVGGGAGGRGGGHGVGGGGRGGEGASSQSLQLGRRTLTRPINFFTVGEASNAIVKLWPTPEPLLFLWILNRQT